MRYAAGGIISLAQFVNDHSEALNYDLITRTGYTIDDAGDALPWGALYAFIKNLRGDSALARSTGTATGWEGILKTNELLADIYDLLQVMNANLVALGKHKQAKKITPYPRPGAAENKQKLGKGALPIGDLREWIRRRQNGRR